jgi:hypothetical protein
MTLKIHKTTTLHFKEGTSDKVYIAITFENESIQTSGRFSTFFLHGKIWKKDLIYVAGCDNVNISVAENVAEKQVLAKLKKGYQDITSASYMGILKATDGWLTREINNAVSIHNVEQVNRDKPTEPEQPKGKTLMEIFAKEDAKGECVCVDDFGIRDTFIEGNTYECRKHEIPTMLWVKDREGVERELMLRRFEVKENAKTRTGPL